MRKRISKKTKRYIAAAAVFFVLVGVGGFVALVFSSNRLIVEQIDSIVVQQADRETQFSSVSASFDDPTVVVNPYGNSPLTALVIFKTPDSRAVTVTVKGKDSQSTFTHTFPPATEHRLPIYGLYAGSDNHIVLQAADATKTLTVPTDPLPDTLVLPTKVQADKTSLSNELYFFTPSSTGHAVAYDSNGDVRWYLTQKASWKIDRLENGHLLLSTERLINAPYYTTGLYEMDLLGKVYAEYSLPGGYHHDYFEMENGNLLVATDDFTNEAGTVEDVVVEFERSSGRVVKMFDLKNILPQKDGQSADWVEYDWFHNNSVWYDKKTNSITLSGRHQDAVVNISYDNGKLNWIIGDPTNWGDDYKKYFFTPVGDVEWQWSQHAAMITPEGYVFVLDNGNNKSKIKSQYVPSERSYTRGVMYKIDTTHMTIEQVWQYGKERGPAFYSPYISDVDYHGPGHYIVHSGGISYKNGAVLNVPAGLGGADTLVSDTVELVNDRVVFEIVLPTNNYRVEKMSLYTDKDTELQLGTARRLGSIGQTPVESKRQGLVLGGQKFDDVMAQHDISLKQEVDRLEVKGRFRREDTVKILLHKNFSTLVYDMRISKKPYTALCVDIFTEEENKNGIVVAKYINAEGLDGKYAIYLEINGVTYNTGRYVDFHES